jgi:hypothetical protein
VCRGVVFSGIFYLYLLLNIIKRSSPATFEKKSDWRVEHVLGKRMEKVAVVPKTNLGQIWSSPQLQPLREEHTLAKAERRATKKNLELGGVMLSSNSLVFIDKNLSLDYFQQLGISCGVSDQNKLDNVQCFLASNLEIVCVR